MLKYFFEGGDAIEKQSKYPEEWFYETNERMIGRGLFMRNLLEFYRFLIVTANHILRR
jgi:hypothetical protein